MTPIESHVHGLLLAVGENPDRPGLRETPARYARALEELTAGYQQNPADVLKIFEEEATSIDEMVIVTEIPVFSLCEHHMLPFFGKAAIGYVPDGRIVGLSKFARLVDVFACRLQLQERLTVEIADAFWEHVKPQGVGVQLKCRHMCMEMRGVKRSGAKTTTTALKGCMWEGEVRDEFLKACR